jgi:hypothetical protein
MAETPATEFRLPHPSDVPAPLFIVPMESGRLIFEKKQVIFKSFRGSPVFVTLWDFPKVTENGDTLQPEDK